MAASLAGGKGIEAAELAIRAGLTSLGRGVLEDLLTADAGYRGPRIGCGTGHQAEFVSCLPKTVDTVLGPVTVNRAWYHCAACGHGLAPRDAELGVAGETMSPGLAKMAARAAEAVPFIRGAGLAGALAGIQLTGRRLGRHAEADGRAPPPSLKPRPPRSPRARWSRCRPLICRTSCTSRSTAPACR